MHESPEQSSSPQDCSYGKDDPESVLTFALTGASLSQWLRQAGLFLRVAAMGPCCLPSVLFILFGVPQF